MRAARARPRVSLDRDRPAPRVFPLERLVEVEDVDELVAAVGRLAHEEPEVDQREYDIPDLAARPDAPMLEDEAGHDAKALERQIPARKRQSPAGGVPALVEPLLGVLEGRQDEHVGPLVEALLPKADAVHDAV